MLSGGTDSTAPDQHLDDHRRSLGVSRASEADDQMSGPGSCVSDEMAPVEGL